MMVSLGADPRPLEPPKKVVRPAATGPSIGQAQLAQVAKALAAEERASLKLAPAGILGLWLLATAGILIWRRK